MLQQRETGRAQRTVRTPIGVLRLEAEGGALRRVHLDGGGEGTDVCEDRGKDGVLARAAEQFAEYFEGRRTVFDLPLELRGTPFQVATWRALLTIRYGETISYRELAKRVGRPTAFRAVGAANGANPLAIVVPCHRVIAADGTLGGYAGGLEMKSSLLELEGGGLGFGRRG